MFSVGCAALAALVPACSSSDAPSGGSSGAPGGGSSGAPGGGASGLAVNTFTGPGDAANGATVFASTTWPMSDATCSSCHGGDAAGLLGPNITFSTTAGIGAWTEEQFFQAVRNRKSRAGATLCKEMSPTSDGMPFAATLVSDKEIGDIFAFLKTKMSDMVNRGVDLQIDPACNTP